MLPWSWNHDTSLCYVLYSFKLPWTTIRMWLILRCALMLCSVFGNLLFLLMNKHISTTGHCWIPSPFCTVMLLLQFFLLPFSTLMPLLRFFLVIWLWRIVICLFSLISYLSYNLKYVATFISYYQRTPLWDAMLSVLRLGFPHTVRLCLTYVWHLFSDGSN